MTTAENLFHKIAESAITLGYNSEMDDIYGMEKDAAIFNPKALQSLMKTMGKSWGKALKDPVNAFKGMTGAGTLTGRSGRALSGNALNVTRDAWKTTRSGLLPRGEDIAKVFGKGTDHTFGRSLGKLVKNPIQALSALSGKGDLVKGVKGNAIYGGAKDSRIMGFQNAWGNVKKPFDNAGKLITHPIQAASAIGGSGSRVATRSGNPIYGAAKDERIKGFQNWWNRATDPIIAR